MKRNYETPVVEKIEFDYVETVTANSCGGGCGNGNGSNDFDPWGYSVNSFGQTVYMQGHPGDPCQSRLAPNEGCGETQAKERGRSHTDNPGYFC